jgi:hypothetical protein
MNHESSECFDQAHRWWGMAFWPKAEIVDAEVQAHFSSALERKAEISLLGYLMAATDPDCVKTPLHI